MLLCDLVKGEKRERERRRAVIGDFHLIISYLSCIPLMTRIAIGARPSVKFLCQNCQNENAYLVAVAVEKTYTAESPSRQNRISINYLNHAVFASMTLTNHFGGGPSK